MKRLLKSVASFTLVMMILTNFSILTHAQTTVAQENILSSLKDIDISDIPEGITPFVFNSEQELIEYAEKYWNPIKINERINIAEKSLIDADSRLTRASNLSTMAPASYSSNSNAYLYSSYTTSKDLIKIGVSIASLNLTTDYVGYDQNIANGGAGPANYKIISANGSCYLSGYTIGTSIGNYAVNSTIFTNKRGFTTTATGSLERYIILEGIGKIYEEPFTITHTFNLYY